MHEKLERMKDNLICAAEMEMCNLGEADAEELSAVINMIKDLEEAIYYCTVTKAMKENEKEIELEIKKGDSPKSKEKEGESRMYYTAPRYPMSYTDDEEDEMMYARGGGRGRGRGRRRRANGQFYADELMEDGGWGSSYAQGNRGSQGGGGGNSYADSGSSYADGGQGGSSSYAAPMYADGGSGAYAERDAREGRSYNSRRMYMEAKDMKRDKATQLRELEKYMQELSQDVVEMINDASPEEKQYLEKKITALASKVGQMK